MRKISICDITLSLTDAQQVSQLTFRVKLELAKLLSSLGVDAIGTAPVGKDKTDGLIVKSLASSIHSSTLAVPVDLMDPESPSRTWESLKCASRPRLVVPVPVSTVQMEYFCHLKPAALLQKVADCIRSCVALCPEVEVVARDFDRTDEAFLSDVMKTAADCGAGIFTVEDVAGNILPEDFRAKVSEVRKALPRGIRLGVNCSNGLYLADACAVAAVAAGADEVKTVSAGNSAVSLKRFPVIMQAVSYTTGASCGTDCTKLGDVASKLDKLCEITSGKLQTVLPCSTEETETGSSEQVPPTYVLDSFLVNTGNTVTPSCHIRIRRGDDLLENVCLGDGPIDAAFIAIENATGKHYELDDFQIRAVTEGREALGETVVRLREGGNVYTGRGVSKDIVASGVEAYLNAMNRIAWEEAQK